MNRQALSRRRWCAAFTSGPSFSHRILMQENWQMMSSKKWWMGILLTTIGVLASAQALTGMADENGNDDEDDVEFILAFSTMRGNLPHVDINGNIGAGAPWVIA